MAKVKTFEFDTLSNHAGQRPDKETGSRAVPIYQTASYVFRDSDAGAAMFNIERGGHVYSRISNPTTAVLEERISALEGGVGAVATASGQAAVYNAIATSQLVITSSYTTILDTPKSDKIMAVKRVMCLETLYLFG